MHIVGLGTAVPPRSFTQAECWDALQRADRPEITLRTRAVLKGILNHDHGIERRSLALDSLDEGFDLDPDTLHRRFLTHAPKLASRAAADALAAAGIAPREVDAVVVSTCTGYLCPGLTSYVAEALELRSDALHLDLVGQGCGAALPNLRTWSRCASRSAARPSTSTTISACS
jgi:alkylresorcinol/alkylpyrone synthase